MNALTKVFVVLLVVCSLLLAAGNVVFINRVDNFKTAHENEEKAIATAKAATATANSALASKSAEYEKLVGDLQRALADSQRSSDEQLAMIGQLKADKADLSSQLKVGEVALANGTGALATSEASRKSIMDSLTAARTENDQLTRKSEELNLAVADLTSKVDVLTRKFNNSLEENVALKQVEQEERNQINKAGITQESTSGLPPIAPPIDGVVRAVRSLNGIPTATISVGSSEQVAKGMVFKVFDLKKDGGTFLGELTVDNVGEHDATGRLTGPKVQDVTIGTQVKTQL